MNHTSPEDRIRIVGKYDLVSCVTVCVCMCAHVYVCVCVACVCVCVCVCCPTG